jgi:hypothetical protein
VSTADAVRTFYRLIPTERPTVDDFRSDKDLGEPPPRGDPELVRMWQGISVNNTETQARNKGRDLPWLGGYIAVLEIPAGGTITYRRTGRGRGHYTVWGDPNDLLRCVVRVVPVEPSPPDRD